MIFENRLSPFLFHFKVAGTDVGLRWYGLAYIAGFWLGWLAFRAAIRKGAIPGATPKTLESLIFAVIAGVLAGGRLGYVIQNFDQWRRDVFFPIEIWHGGMAFFGGLVGVLIALAWIGKRERISLLALSDVATLPALAGLGLGRLANFANRELWGRPTGGNWGVIYPNVDRLPRHPSELYEAASHFLAFAILQVIVRRNPKPGTLSAWFLILYGVLRTITDFWRDEPLAGPLNTGQWASLIIAGCGLALLPALRRSGRKAPVQSGDHKCTNTQSSP